MINQTYTVLHLFGGLGGAALGMQNADSEYRGVKANFMTIGGIDCDPDACSDFETLTGAPAFQMDLFSRDDYIAFHGQEPPATWREVTPDDLRELTGGINPDVIFTSPPCKGFSGLLPSKSAQSDKYQALNRLTVRGIRLSLEAFKDDLPGIILLENVPRITTRGADLLTEIKGILAGYGYLFHEGYHDCGEIGGLGQYRKRYLLIARHKEKITNFVYLPPVLRVKSIGEVIGPLPLPDDPTGGPMHRLPRLQWKTWVRLALIPAGGDWRDLEKIAPEQYRLVHVPRKSTFGVNQWDEPGPTVIGHTRVGGSQASAIADPRVDHFKHSYRVTAWDKTAGTITGGCAPSNGATCVADPRLTQREGRHPGVYRVVKFDEPAPCVTGTRFGSGAPAIADPRTGGGYANKFQLLGWDKAASTITGTPDIQAGAPSIADPRLNPRDNRRSNSYTVRPWDGQAHTITGEDSLGSGAQSIADPRTGFKESTHHAIYQVNEWDGPARTVTGAMRPNNGAITVADPRLKCSCRNGSYGVQDWDKPGNTVVGAGDIHSGAAAVSDPRIPADNETGTWIIISLDGTRHRPLTTWELLALQGFPVYMPDGSPVILAGKSDAKWRERIGNAVPPPAAQAIGEQILRTLLLSAQGVWELSATPIWVRREVRA